jgi:uncharacterized protein (TIGR00255 family)
MTGYARAEGAQGALAWTWELRSVNGKGLDIRLRMPPGLEHLENDIRKRLGAGLGRGNVNASLDMRRAAGAQRYVVNEALLGQILALAPELEKRTELRRPSLDGLLALRGMLEPAEDTPDAAEQADRDAALLESLDAALAGLREARAREGAALAEVLAGQLDEIERLHGRAAELAAAQPAALRERLRQRLDELLADGPDIAEDRLAQEVALLAGKADVREELDRLSAHVASAREMLAQGGVIGRRLDFLAQEFNREANTLCSKSADVTLTNVGLELKTVIDQVREQVQNVE